MQIILPALGWQDPIYQQVFAGWITPLAGPYIASLAYAVVFVAIWWVIVWMMDRNKWYAKL
jgi:predicted acyltransferase